MTRALVRPYVPLSVAAALSLGAGVACSDSTSPDPARVVISLVAPPAEIAVGDTLAIAAAVSQGGRALDAPITFRSLTPTTVAVVPGPGSGTRIAIRAAGIARVEASAAGHADTLELQADRYVTRVTFDGGARDSLLFGAAASLVALAGDGAPIESIDVAFTSSDVSVVTVDAAGVLTPRAFGTATVSATTGSRTARQTVRVVPEQILPGAQVFDVGGGWMHSCASVFVPGDAEFGAAGIACWGTEINRRGTLGRGTGGTTNIVDATPRRVMAPEGLASLSVGGDHSCAIGTTTRATYCWGKNVYGEIGQGTRSLGTVQGIDRATAVQSTQQFQFVNARVEDGTCAITMAGFPYCWGANGTYQTGRAPRVAADPVVAAVPGAPTLSKIYGGFGHTCGLTGPGLVWCWGLSASVGPARHDSTYTPSAVRVDVPAVIAFRELATTENATCGLTTMSEAWCWGAAAPTPRRYADGLGFTALSGDYDEMCGLTSAGAIHCWSVADGAAATPRLASGSLVITKFAVGDREMVAFTSDNRLVRWPRN